MKKFAIWLFKKVCCREQGVHVFTVVNLNFDTVQKKRSALWAYEKYESARLAALDQLKAEIARVYGGDWEERND